MVTYDDSMGYQALLFCPDEKTARVVTQVLSELDFAVDTASEPFAAVKKLMAQHFDALVVDCENEQNASLLFRSARNSNANQSSLAVAVVEGQAGVAKAFRIGANLVLTKPINVEQSKGTLRVARGLLRKGSDAAKAPAAQASPSEQPFSLATNAQRQKPSLTPGTPPTKPLSPFPGTRIGQGSAAAPKATRAAVVVAAQNATPASSVSTGEKRTPPQSLAPIVPVAETSKRSGAEADMRGPVPNPPFISTVSSGQGTAAASAPARELPNSLLEALDASSTPTSSAAAPSFSTLDIEGEKKSFAIGKILGIVAAIAVIAVAAYFGYKHGNKGEETLSPNASEMQPASAPAPAAIANQPTSSAASNRTPKPSAAPAASQSTPRASVPAPAASKPSPSTKGGSSENIAEDSTVRLENEEAEKSEPIKVKSDLAQAAHGKSPTATESVLPPAPGALNLGGSNSDSAAVSNLVAPVSVPKPSPEVLNISQGLTQGMILKRVQPVYPQQALAMRVQGGVELQATIGKDGAIKNVKVLKGDGLLARAAVDAVRQWKYKPYYLNGEPVEIQTEVTVNFKLPN